MNDKAIEPPLLLLDGIYVELGGLQILRDVTFDVRPGEIFGIVGPNGAGKTTILNVIGGVVRPAGGTVRYRERSLSGVPPHRMRDLGIGRSLQSTHYFRDLTARQLVALGETPNTILGALRFGGHRRQRQARHPGASSGNALNALDALGLSEYADRPLSELSSAVQKLVDMCRAVTCGTDLVLLDEPTSGVGVRERGVIGSAIRQLRALGRTVVLIDHDPGFVTGNCDRLMAMNFGEVLRVGTPEEVMSDEVVKRSYLGESTEENKP